jgi:VIT1/CCC1 family predicted Fe2+/Mn2+ transporter
LVWVAAAASLVLLPVLGALSAHTGGASMPRAIVRVTFWGALAMALTAGAGRVFAVAA